MAERTRVDVVVPGGWVRDGGPRRYRGWLVVDSQRVVYRWDEDGRGCDYRPERPWSALTKWQWSGPAEVTGTPDLPFWKTMREAIEGARDEDTG